MHRLTFNVLGSNESFSLTFKTLDFLNFAKQGDIIKIKNKSYLVDDVKIERTIKSTHPMIEPSGFDLVVSMTLFISEAGE